MSAIPIPLSEIRVRRICERMLHALDAPVTDANLAKLTLFAGMLASMAKDRVCLDAVESMVMGVDVATKVNGEGGEVTT